MEGLPHTVYGRIARVGLTLRNRSRDRTAAADALFADDPLARAPPFLAGDPGGCIQRPPDHRPGWPAARRIGGVVVFHPPQPRPCLGRPPRGPPPGAPPPPPPVPAVAP